MKALKLCIIPAVLFFALCLNAPSILGQTANDKPALDIFEMRSIPEGDYKASLSWNGVEIEATIRIKGNAGKFVKVSDTRFEKMTGRFELLGGNGVFVVTFTNGPETATQFWLFRPDGTVVIKENPDRGEKQVAKLVKE